MGLGIWIFLLNTCVESKMASMTMDEFKCEEINFVLGWLQENGFERLKRVSEGKKNFVIPKLRHAVASNSYMGWGIWTPIFHNTWCIWTGIANICREFDLTKTSKSKFPGVCPGGGCQGFDLIRALVGCNLSTISFNIPRHIKDTIASKCTGKGKSILEWKTIFWQLFDKFE